MNEKINGYKDKIIQFWNNFSKNQKIIFISTLALVIGSIIIITMMLSKTEYEVAFKDLNASDAAGIMTHLEESNIAYKLSPDGKSISVPTTQSARAKVDVGSQGIVENGSIGYKIFEQSSSTMGMTDSEFDVKYNNALNGEVEQLLKRMSGIQDAKVLISLPESSVFASTGDEDKATASAVLQFKMGYRPNQEAIDGYYNLMKTAIPNLPVENITISNNEVELVSTIKGGQGVVNTALEANFALQKRFENEVRQNVKKFLTQFTGEGKVEVLVASKLNFDKIASKENMVTPVNEEDMKGIEISVQKISKNYSGSNEQDSGVPGTGQEEIPGYPSNNASGTTTSEELSETVNYDVNRITRDIISSPYTVKDLTINVAVEPPTGKNNLDDVTQDAIKNVLVNIVRASVADSGIIYTDADLDKKVSVYSQNYNAVDDDGKAGINLSAGMLWGIGLAVLALLAVGGYLIYRRRNRNEEFEEDVPLQVPTEFPSINMESMTNESQVRKQLETLAKKKPDEFVNLLRTWLADE
ncbi:flagellar basal-body MS-ring/collar protein FliF [Paenibacillus sp. CMAA1364]